MRAQEPTLPPRRKVRSRSSVSLVGARYSVTAAITGRLIQCFMDYSCRVADILAGLSPEDHRPSFGPGHRRQSHRAMQPGVGCTSVTYVTPFHSKFDHSLLVLSRSETNPC
jgi:hypothetical protein